MSENKRCQWRSGPKHSHLCKDLLTTLKDDSPDSLMEYFIQYMESINAVQLIQFWLSVESFKAARLSSNFPTHAAPAETPSTPVQDSSAHTDHCSSDSEVSESQPHAVIRDCPSWVKIHEERPQEDVECQQHWRSSSAPTNIDKHTREGAVVKQVNSALVLV